MCVYIHYSIWTVRMWRLGLTTRVVSRVIASHRFEPARAPAHTHTYIRTLYTYMYTYNPLLYTTIILLCVLHTQNGLSDDNTYIERIENCYRRYKVNIVFLTIYLFSE